jgi:hypothetical protein
MPKKAFVRTVLKSHFLIAFLVEVKRDEVRSDDVAQEPRFESTQ